MRSTRKLVIAGCIVFAAGLAWAYWHSMTHASLNLRVDDYGLKTDRQLYGTPHHVTLKFFDAANAFLAAAHSIEPDGYLMATHPDPKIGDCLQYQNSPEDYKRCFALHSKWAADWAPRVRSATADVGTCSLGNLPVDLRSSNGDWWLWWVPLPHVGGVPRRYIELVVNVNTKSCTAKAQ
jgi:hypothetical protein